MALLPAEKKTIHFLLRHMVLGMAGGFSFGLGVLYFDVAHLWTLALNSDSPVETIGLLFFGLLITWGSAGMAVGIMTQTGDEN